MPRAFIHLMLLVAFTMAGCVPYPHTYQRIPNVTGSVVERGVPVVGAEVCLGEISEDGSFTPTSTPVMTSADGSFAAEGKRRMRLYVLAAPADSFEKWAVRIKAPGRDPVVYARRNLRAGPVSAPESVKVCCDLAEVDVCKVIEEKNGKW